MESCQNNDTSLISAVIPTVNRPDLVCRAVRSALNQTYANLEVVVVVDGPDPATVRVLEALCEPRLRIIALPENVGGSEARNIGVRESRGEFVSLLDDDDEWTPEKIGKQYEAFVEQVSSECLIASKCIGRSPGQKDRLLPSRSPRAKEHISEYMYYAPCLRRPVRGIGSPSYFSLRKLFIATPFRKGLTCHQDWDWFLRVMSRPNIKLILLEEPLYIAHGDPLRSSVSKNISWRDSLNWLDTSVNLFTLRASCSFIVHVCMPRCDESIHRYAAFRLMLKKCHNTSHLNLWHIILAVKWYMLSPQIRRYIRNISLSYRIDY